MRLITTIPSMENLKERLSEYEKVYVFTKEDEKISVTLCDSLLNSAVENRINPCSFMTFKQNEDIAFLMGTILNDSSEYDITEDVYRLPDNIMKRFKVNYIKAGEISKKRRKAVATVQEVIKTETVAEPVKEEVQNLKKKIMPYERGCIRGKNPYGICSCCGSDGVQCCDECKNDCNGRCGWYQNTEIEHNPAKQDVKTAASSDKAVEKLKDVTAKPEKKKPAANAETGKKSAEPPVSEKVTDEQKGGQKKDAVKTSKPSKTEKEVKTEKEKPADAPEKDKPKIIKADPNMSEEDKRVMDFVQISGLRVSKLPQKMNVKDKAMGEDLLRIIAESEYKTSIISKAVTKQYGSVNEPFIMTGVARYLDFMDLAADD